MAEIEHCRIDYRPKRLYWLRMIMHLRRRDDGQLHEARDQHLLTLQEACGRGDCGEFFEGRT